MAELLSSSDDEERQSHQLVHTNRNIPKKIDTLINPNEECLNIVLHNTSVRPLKKEMKPVVSAVDMLMGCLSTNETKNVSSISKPSTKLNQTIYANQSSSSILNHNISKVSISKVKKIEHVKHENEVTIIKRNPTEFKDKRFSSVQPEIADSKRAPRKSSDESEVSTNILERNMLDDNVYISPFGKSKVRHQTASNLALEMEKESRAEVYNTDMASGYEWLSNLTATTMKTTDTEVRVAKKRQSMDSNERSTKKYRKKRYSYDSYMDNNDSGELIDQIWPQLPLPVNTTGQTTGELILSSQTLSLSVCANFNRYLFGYQREGVKFLFQAYANNTGAILGDDMGLGKTIQVIALLSAILHKKGDSSDIETWRHQRHIRRRLQSATKAPLGSSREIMDNKSLATCADPILIVVPASLLHNWEAELKIWVSCCSVLIHGKPQEREKLLEDVLNREFEVVICSYDMLKCTVAQLGEFSWEVVILDEMHCLKNPESGLTKAVKAIKCPRKLGLTGTLMQNNEKELHCLIDAIAPGVLGSWREFQMYYGNDIKYGRKRSALSEALERSKQKEKELRDKLGPYYLRREKSINPTFQDVSKNDQIVFCELTPLQLATYQRVLDMPEFILLRRGDEVCDCGRVSKRKRKRCCYQVPNDLGCQDSGVLFRKFHNSGTACKHCPNCMALICVAQLLKIANHMELIKVDDTQTPAEQAWASAFAVEAFGSDLEKLGGVNPVRSFQVLEDLGTSTCGKMKVLAKLLSFWKQKREKTLIFSRSTRMLDIIQSFLIGNAYTYARLDGQTKVEDRLSLVNRFNSEGYAALSIFLISTRAGGVGLNLPSACNVVIFDPSWNPAHDCQAQDRAYRIGQTKNVNVYRLITLGTIEEMIYVRQIYKQQLSDTTLKEGIKAPRYFEGVQGDSKQHGELFGIANLLCWKKEGVLKGIQDAYYNEASRRQNELGITVEENRIQVDEKRAHISEKKSRTSMKVDDDEMVDIADELIDEDLLPALDAVEIDSVGDNKQVSISQDCLKGLSGARSLRHDAIVSANGQSNHTIRCTNVDNKVTCEEPDKEKEVKEEVEIKSSPSLSVVPIKKEITSEIVNVNPTIKMESNMYIPKYLKEG